MQVLGSDNLAAMANLPRLADRALTEFWRSYYTWMCSGDLISWSSWEISSVTLKDSGPAIVLLWRLFKESLISEGSSSLLGWQLQYLLRKSDMPEVVLFECAPYQFPSAGDQKRVLRPQCIKFPSNILWNNEVYKLCMQPSSVIAYREIWQLQVHVHNCLECKNVIPCSSVWRSTSIQKLQNMWKVVTNLGKKFVRLCPWTPSLHMPNLTPPICLWWIARCVPHGEAIEEASVPASDISSFKGFNFLTARTRCKHRNIYPAQFAVQFQRFQTTNSLKVRYLVTDLETYVIPRWRM